MIFSLKNKTYNRVISPLRKLSFLVQNLSHNNISSEKLKKIQLKKLKHILEYSYANIPFYRKRFDNANIHPKDLKTLEDLGKFPITSREDDPRASPHRYG